MSINGDKMIEEHYGKSELLEVRQVRVKKPRRNRVFSWGFKIPSYNPQFYSQFEVFLLKPDKDDLLRQDEEGVFVKFQNGNRFVSEKVRLKDFLESPFCSMLNQDARNVLLERANELNLMRFNMLEELREGFE